MRQHGFYKTGSFILLIWSFILLTGVYNVKAITENRAYAKEAYVDGENVTSRRIFGLLDNSASQQRVVTVSMMERDYIMDITNEDY